MGAETDIGWVRNSDGSKGATINFWIGCTEVSRACDNCYAREWANRFKVAEWGAGKPRVARLEKAAAEAFRLQRKARRLGIRIRVFSNSLSDFFDKEVPDDWRDFAMAVIALTPDLDWMVLAKRPKVARKYLTEKTRWDIWRTMPLVDPAASGCPCPTWPLPNLWLGTTAEDQNMAELRISELLATQAALHWVSLEPLLGPIDLRNLRQRPHDGEAFYLDALTGEAWSNGTEHSPPWHNPAPTNPRLGWVIVGGESGRKARPMHPDWARAIRDQCVAAGVDFFFKQWGEWAELRSRRNGQRIKRHPRYRTCVLDADGTSRQHLAHCRDPERAVVMARCGRKALGTMDNVLDGFLWDQVPRTTSNAGVAHGP